MSADPRESKLPGWAQHVINNLRKQLSTALEPIVAENNRLRNRNEQLKTRNEALTELLECAAVGGHKTAKEIMDIIGAYGLELVKEEDEKGTDDRKSEVMTILKETDGNPEGRERRLQDLANKER